MFVDAVVDHVCERAPDLLHREFKREGVKLHATLMNSHFPTAIAKKVAKKEGVGIEGNWRKRENEAQKNIPLRQKFDATSILKVYMYIRILYVNAS